MNVLFCFLFVLAFDKVKAVNEPGYELSFFNKVGENNNPITNAEFKQMTLDGLVLYDTTQEEASEKQLGHYYYMSNFQNKDSV